jgi:C4-dicarboxylate-specific signal transduction histidine kinase
LSADNPTPFRLPIEIPRAYDPSLLEAIHVMIAELRHELGNPLNSIKAALTLVRRGIGTYPLEKTLTYLDATLAEVARLERLLLSLRRLSEPSARTPEVFDLGPFLEEFLAAYGYEVERRGIVLESRPAAAGRVAVDPEALSQVLLDLLNGTVQRLGRVEEPRLEIKAGPQGEIYAIELHSNGRAAEEGKELPFATSMLGPREDDYRLALAISRQILLQMGAAVTTVQLTQESWISRIELPLVAISAARG